jgi:cell division protein FtsQ
MKRLLNISVWSLFILGTLALLSFTHRMKNKSICQKWEIKVDSFSGNYFVTPERIENILSNVGLKKGQDKFDDIDTKKLENKLMSLSSVENVEVFKNMNGTLEVNVKQRQPIARVFNRNGYSVYVDENGKTMQVSEYYTARVMVVNGFVNIKSGEEMKLIQGNDSLMELTLLDEIFELTTYIRNDEFLKAQIEQIYVEKNQEIVLIPKVGNQEIIFGKAENIKTKFDKLILFYKEGINPNNLNLYKTINLKFDNQIVCKKNK